jgi:3-oxoadipate enol-lactonase
VVGYSMGGAIAQLVARDHPDVAAGVVLSGTAQHWQDPRTRRAFKAMGAMGLLLSVAPKSSYRIGLRRSGIKQNERTVWLQSELMRHSARDLAEAGRELGRFDSRPWLGEVTPPIAVVLTTRDDLVAPRKQRALAEAAGARVFEVPIRHLEVGWRGEEYNPQLREAIAAVSSHDAARAA